MDARLQSVGGGGPPKWDPRARLGIYLGHSPSHAGSVALVMNPKTGLVSPQFNLVFDDNFETVPQLRAGTVPRVCGLEDRKSVVIRQGHGRDCGCCVVASCCMASNG